MTDLADRLAEHLDGQFDLPDDDEARSGFRIDDDGKACWALRKLARVQRRAAEVRQLAQDQRDIIDAWEQDELAVLARDEAMFDGALGDYWRRQLMSEVDDLMATGLTFEAAWAKIKVKSKRLPAGTISATKGRDSVVIEDEEALVAWAREHAPDLVVTTEVTKVPKDALAQYNRDGAGFVTPDGEKVPAVRVDNPGVTWKAKPTEV